MNLIAFNFYNLRATRAQVSIGIIGMFNVSHFANGKHIKGEWRMPRHQKTMKDAA